MIPFPNATAIDRRRKAAIVVRFLLADGLRPPLADLPEDAQIELTREMGRLPLVDRATLEAVITEFADALEGVGLAPPSGEDEALAALSGHISPAVAARLKAESSARRGSDPWRALAALTSAEIATALSRESLEVAAVALSKLPVAKAAEVLGKLPGPVAQRMTLAMSRTARVAPEAVLRIGRALAEEHCSSPSPAFASPAGERLGAILNSSPPATREEVLGGLEAEDLAFAAEVRRAIFTFAHLARRLAPTDVPKVLRGIEPRLAALALAAAQAAGGAEAESAEFLLANLPKRLAESLREEMSGLGRIKPAEAEVAQAAVIDAVRERVAAGEVELLEEDAEAGT